MLITNEDNMELMARYEDNHFDLAIVDPPYGIDAVNSLNTVTGGKKHTSKDWDNKTPNKEYFDELFRVSKNQIIWGANYFIDKMPINTKCWIVWDKNNGESSFADGELAWTSFDKNVSIIKSHWCGSAAKWETGQNKIHPTQKPERLYRWLLEKYANEGDKILDTHLGSGSIAIACDKENYDLVACELDKEYYDAAIKRIEQHKAQIRMF
jgi:site-specific DNA-methyltransferase (adenine-specific)